MKKNKIKEYEDLVVVVFISYKEK